jgi:hypothetical protein
MTPPGPLFVVAVVVVAFALLALVACGEPYTGQKAVDIIAQILIIGAAATATAELAWMIVAHGIF